MEKINQREGSPVRHSSPTCIRLIGIPLVNPVKRNTLRLGMDHKQDDKIIHVKNDQFQKPEKLTTEEENEMQVTANDNDIQMKFFYQAEDITDQTEVEPLLELCDDPYQVGLKFEPKSISNHLDENTAENAMEVDEANIKIVEKKHRSMQMKNEQIDQSQDFKLEQHNKEVTEPLKSADNSQQSKVQTDAEIQPKYACQSKTAIKKHVKKHCSSKPTTSKPLPIHTKALPVHCKAMPTGTKSQPALANISCTHVKSEPTLTNDMPIHSKEQAKAVKIYKQTHPSKSNTCINIKNITNCFSRKQNKSFSEKLPQGPTGKQLVPDNGSPVSKAKRPSKITTLSSICMYFFLLLVCACTAKNLDIPNMKYKYNISDKCKELNLGNKCKEILEYADNFKCCSHLPNTSFYCINTPLKMACMPNQTVAAGNSMDIVNKDNKPQIILKPCDNMTYQPEDRMLNQVHDPKCTKIKTECDAKVGQTKVCSGGTNRDDIGGCVKDYTINGNCSYILNKNDPCYCCKVTNKRHDSQKKLCLEQRIPIDCQGDASTTETQFQNQRLQNMTILPISTPYHNNTYIKTAEKQDKCKEKFNPSSSNLTFGEITGVFGIIAYINTNYFENHLEIKLMAVDVHKYWLPETYFNRNRSDMNAKADCMYCNVPNSSSACGWHLLSFTYTVMLSFLSRKPQLMLLKLLEFVAADAAAVSMEKLLDTCKVGIRDTTDDCNKVNYNIMDSYCCGTIPGTRLHCLNGPDKQISQVACLPAQEVKEGFIVDLVNRKGSQNPQINQLPCDSTHYQPKARWSNEIHDPQCTEVKTVCNAKKGEIKICSGNTTRDDLCGCSENYTTKCCFAFNQDEQCYCEKSNIITKITSEPDSTCPMNKIQLENGKCTGSVTTSVYTQLLNETTGTQQPEVTTTILTLKTTDESKIQKSISGFFIRHIVFIIISASILFFVVSICALAMCKKKCIRFN